MGDKLIFKCNDENIEIEIVGVYDWSGVKSDDKLIHSLMAEETVDISGIIWSSDVLEEVIGTDNKGALIMYMDNFMSASEIVKILNTKFHNIVSGDSDEWEKYEKYTSLASGLFILIGSTLGIVALVNIFSNLIMDIKRQRYLLSVKKIIGFSNKILSAEYYLKISLILVSNLVISFIAAFISCEIMTIIINKRCSRFGYEIDCSFLPDIKAAVIIACFIIGFIILVAFSAFRRIRSIDCLEVLKEQT